MARLVRRGNADDHVPRSSSRTPVVDFSSSFGEWNSREHEPSNHSSATLHSPSSWQRAQKIQNQSPSKQRNRHVTVAGSAAPAAYDLHPASRSKPPPPSFHLPATPNASIHLQRALTPKQPSIPSGNVMRTPNSSRPSTAAGSSLPPRSISSRGVSSVEYFAASEATVLRRSCDNLHETNARAAARDVPASSKQRQSTPLTSNDPIVQLASAVLDPSHNHSFPRGNPVLAGLQQELSKLQAHRAMELHRLTAAMQHPPANLLMRERNLPESLPSEHGKLELSLRNSTFFNGQGYKALHANQPIIALKHFAAAFNLSKTTSQSFRNVFALGALAATNRDLTKAAQLFRAAITCDDRQALAHFALGSVYFLQDNCAEALQCYDRAIELNGDIKEFFHNRALVLRRMGRYEEATGDYTTPAIMHHRAIEKQILEVSFSVANDDAAVREAPSGDVPAKVRQVEAAKSSIITQALATNPPHRTASQVNIICNSLLSNAFFKMQPSPLQPDIAAHLVLLDVPAGEIAISENADVCDDVYLIWNGRFSLSRGSVKQSVGEEGAEGAIEDRRQQKIVRSGDCFGDLSHLSPAFKRITGTVGVSQFDKQFLQSSSGQLPLCVWPMTATALEPSQVLILRVEQYIAMVNRKLQDEEIGRLAWFANWYFEQQNSRSILRRAFFNDVAQLAEWTPSEVDRLCSSIRMQTLPNRHLLVKQGSMVNGLYFIKRGRCIVRRSLSKDADANANIEASIIRRAAAAADADGDGNVSTEEVAAALSAARPKSIWKPVVNGVLEAAQRAYLESKTRRAAGNEYADYKGDLLGMTDRERQEFKYEFESIYKKEKDREEDRLRRKALGLLDLKQQSFSKTYERIGAILTVVDAGLDAVAAAVELELQQKGAAPGPKQRITSHQHVHTLGDILKLPSMQQLTISKEDLIQQAASAEPQASKKVGLVQKHQKDRTDLQVTILTPGQWFGAECIIGDGDLPAIFTIETHDPCVEIFFLHTDHCFQLYRKHTLGKFMAVFMQWLESLPAVVNADHEWAKTKIALLKEITYKKKNK